MDLQRSRKMIRRMRKIFLTSLSMLSIASFLFSIPVHADSADVDPADYVTGITVVDGVKTVNYEFAGVEPYVSAWDNSSGGIIVRSDSEIWGDTGYEWELGQGAQQFALTLCPIGWHVAEGWDCERNRILVSDIIPGCPIDISFSVGAAYYVFGVSEGFEYYNGFTAGFYTYDKNGKYLDTVSLRIDDSVSSDGDDVFGHVYEISGTIPLNAYAILPWFKLDCWLGAYDPDLQIQVDITPGVLKMSTAVDSIVEQSHQMTIIQDKLDDIGGKLDGTNDRLDEIISGGEAGDSLGAAGDQLEDASGAVSDKADTVTDDISSVGDFESGIMGDIDSALGQIDVSSGVGKFNTSLAFVSNYVQLIFSGVEEWAVAITLPLFLGLFFGICQHVGGVANMRARQAREARNEELHQARLEKIQKGGNK